MLISGFIHDASSFLPDHPGGERLLSSYVGKDATKVFFGGVYRHSNAAQNVRHEPSFIHELSSPIYFISDIAIGHDACWCHRKQQEDARYSFSFGEAVYR